MVIVIEHGSFLGLDWDAVSALATIAAIAIGAIGTGLAWTGVQRQIAVAEGHHRQSTLAAIRPFVVVVAGSIAVRSNSIHCEIRNIGKGPAVSVRGRIWIADVPETVDRSLAEANAVIDSRIAGIRDLEPHYELQATALEVGGQTANWIRTAQALPSLAIGERVVVVYEIESHNLTEPPHTYRSESALAERVSA